MTRVDGAAEAAATRATIVEQQKQQADMNLSQLRFMIGVSQGVEDEYMSGGLLGAIADEECPAWSTYDPLMRAEHIHRYPVYQCHTPLLTMITAVDVSIGDYMRKAADQRRFPGTVDVALQDLEDVSAGALVKSARRWPFTSPAYPSLRFCAHQMLLADSKSVKLFIIVVNESVPYDYFFYFF